MSEVINIEEIFGEDVFNDKAMREKLPKKIYEELKKTMLEGGEISSVVADSVAHAMKEWAIEKGATHYTHWFQPLTGVTAEKHDSFISAPKPDGRVIMEFSGKELIKGEPDASSFPSGGLRATFEARGYTAWDCTSPAFVRHDAAGATLCIPTAFCSYTGEALDKKTPLLRSMQALNTQTIRLLRLLGNTTSKSAVPSVGPEQEYFLVDKNKYLKRKDLIFTGRTLFGAMPPKGQELEDHYFGTIRERVAAFMKDVNIELWKLGVSSKTQHNEVAPAQHELAPIYAQCNIAVDNNQLMMEMLKKVANRHGLTCLLHEKPFAGVNGSGKHDNWSLVTDDGINLLNPGKYPHENTLFLVTLMSVLAGVNKHGDLLRESAANPGNDHRLGADEAPPAIISVFLGDQLEDIVEQIIEKGSATSSVKAERLATGVDTLPDFKKDTTDRNRTSPFAFTGNKFEFRSVGSGDSVASPNIVLNTIVAEQFCEISDELEKVAEDKREEKINEIICRLATENQKIIFNGDGYSEEWVKEAERRGLPNLKTMVDAIPALTTDKAVALFEKFGVFTRAELESREEIQYEAYSKQLNIEARTMIDLASKHLIPAIIRYTTRLADSINKITSAVPDCDVSVQTELLIETSDKLSASKVALSKLIEVSDIASAMAPGREQAVYYKDVVKDAMADLRKPIDELEMIVDKDLWPMPSYGDLIFEV